MTSPVEALREVMEGLSPVREAVRGYRAQLVDDGFSSVVADRMAADLHRELIRASFAGAS